mmetsp:Transcript_114956/g.225542  ORF Transcript_114956/g.225542 Transcript_114956/m.225542 type:complete len:203 (-) Transcript_114956:37-645(-)
MGPCLVAGVKSASCATSHCWKRFRKKTYRWRSDMANHRSSTPSDHTSTPDGSPAADPSHEGRTGAGAASSAGKPAAAGGVFARKRLRRGSTAPASLPAAAVTASGDDDDAAVEGVSDPSWACRAGRAGVRQQPPHTGDEAPAPTSERAHRAAASSPSNWAASNSAAHTDSASSRESKSSSESIPERPTKRRALHRRGPFRAG